jgi:hypothetical protein
MRTISAIARDIQADWKKVNYAAVPYLQAMMEIDSADEHYFWDNAASIVRYFLANSGTWRGPVAKSIKEELRGMI